MSADATMPWVPYSSHLRAHRWALRTILRNAAIDILCATKKTHDALYSCIYNIHSLSVYLPPVTDSRRLHIKLICLEVLWQVICFGHSRPVGCRLEAERGQVTIWFYQMVCQMNFWNNWKRAVFLLQFLLQGEYQPQLWRSATTFLWYGYM